MKEKSEPNKAPEPTRETGSFLLPISLAARGSALAFAKMKERITILPDQVLLDGHDLLKLADSLAFLACFDSPSRKKEIRMHPSGTRIAMVWDSHGFVAYEDRPELRMSHLYLAFSPENTPEAPIDATKA